MNVDVVLIARLLMADEFDRTPHQLRAMYAAETAKPIEGQDAQYREELTPAIANPSDVDADAQEKRDDRKWLILNLILNAELEKPEAERNTDLIDEIIDYLDIKGWS